MPLIKQKSHIIFSFFLSLLLFSSSALSQTAMQWHLLGHLQDASLRIDIRSDG